MTRRALIVDDEATECDLIRGALSSTGMTSLSLTKSSEASEYLQDEKFDVVLLDFRMPAPSGIDLAQLARGSGINQRTPIIMISDDQRPSAVAEGFEAGANFFLYKPIDMSRLSPTRSSDARSHRTRKTPLPPRPRAFHSAPQLRSRGIRLRNDRRQPEWHARQILKDHARRFPGSPQPQYSRRCSANRRNGKSNAYRWRKSDGY